MLPRKVGVSILVELVKSWLAPIGLKKRPLWDQKADHR
jgi:hypothetical protein